MMSEDLSLPNLATLYAQPSNFGWRELVPKFVSDAVFISTCQDVIGTRLTESPRVNAYVHQQCLRPSGHCKEFPGDVERG
jgi:hypothetical protein